MPSRSPATSAPNAAACATCGHPVPESYCGRCGQRRRSGRFNLRALIRDAAEHAFSLDRGFLHTALALTRRPGPAIREYLAGRTRVYTNPVKYLLVVVAAATIALAWAGFMDPAEALGTWERMNPEQRQEVMEFTVRYMNVLLVGVVPLLALFSFIFFRRAGFNFAEALIFNTFVFAQQNLFFFALLPIVLIPAVNPGMFSIVYTVVVGVYYVWAAADFFQAGRVRGVLLGAATYGVAYSVYIFLALLLGAAYRLAS